MANVKILNIPDEKNVFIIGDIHGNYELYQLTLKELGITDDDVVISLGDVIDRGKYNAKMLDEFLTKENRYMILGNHEVMMMDGLTDANWKECWLHNGGQTTLDEIGIDGIVQYCNMLKDIPRLMEVNHRGYKLGLAHAGIPHYTEITDWEVIKEFSESNSLYQYALVWDRNSIEYARHDYEVPDNEKLPRIISGVNYVLHGHTGVPSKLLFGNRVWMDTQFRSGYFTVAHMNEENIMKFRSVIQDPWGTEHTIMEI